jgi:uncharacterized protein with HEPN domain
MTAGKDALVYIEDMLSAIDRINRYCKGLDKDIFFNNEMLQDAVVRNIEIIGEAASKLSESFTKSHPDIQWRTIIAARNRLIHAYDTIDYQIVWDLISVDIPVLEDKLRQLLR